MISLEKEKNKILLEGIPYLRPLYIKGILSMYKILSISWKESLIDLQSKYNNINNNDDKNIVNDNELKDLNNKMFLIFSFMNYFYQMINKGKLKKYKGLDFIYNKLNNFLTFSRHIICYKILDINYDELSHINTILKLIIHIKLFLIFCEYDTYKSQKGFIEELLLILTPKENIYEEKNDNENINNVEEMKENKNISIINLPQIEEKKVIEDLIQEIKKENIKLENISLFLKNKYNSIFEKYEKFIEEDKYTFFTILYESYFDLNSNEETDDNYNNKKEKNLESNDEENIKTEEDSKIRDSEQLRGKKRKRKHKKKKNKNNENINLIESNNKTNNDNNNNINTNEINNINNNNLNELNTINIINENNSNNINEININIKDNFENKNEINKNTKAIINRKITTIKTIQSIAKFVNKMLRNNFSLSEIEDNTKDNSENNLFLPKNKVDFDEIKRKFFEPLIPYIEQYKKIYGNKKMSILYILQCALIVFEEKQKKEKEKLLKEIDNLKKSMNQMFIQIQLMGGGRDIFRSTLYYLILIFIPESQNIPSFFTKVQNLIHFFQNKVNADLLLLKNLVPTPGSNFSENTNQIIKRLHQNSQYVLFIKSLFFMYKYCNYLVHLNRNEKLQKKNNNFEKNIYKEEDNNNINNVNNNVNTINNINNKNINSNDSLVSKINYKNIKYNLPIIKNYFQETNALSIFNNKKDMIYPTFNFNDCFCSYANFLDEMVINEKTQIIIEQVIEKIEKENNEGDVPKFEINDLFSKKDGKRIFNITGFDVLVIIHDIKKMNYKNETFENLVNSKTWEKSQQEN